MTNGGGSLVRRYGSTVRQAAQPVTPSQNTTMRAITKRGGIGLLNSRSRKSPAFYCASSCPRVNRIECSPLSTRGTGRNELALIRWGRRFRIWKLCEAEHLVWTIKRWQRDRGRSGRDQNGRIPRRHDSGRRGGTD